VRVASEPEALLPVLTNPLYRFKRIGLEAGPLSQWLFSAFAEAGLPAICVETRHMRAVLQAQINKTDRNDARGIARMMRAGLYRPVHVKTLRSPKLRMLLTHRKLLQSKAIAIDNDLRGTLRNFGLKVGVVGASQRSWRGWRPSVPRCRPAQRLWVLVGSRPTCPWPSHVEIAVQLADALAGAHRLVRSPLEAF
jgi:transposase